MVEAAVVGVDIVDVEFRVFGLWVAGRGQDVDLQLGASGEGGALSVRWQLASALKAA